MPPVGRQRPPGQRWFRRSWPAGQRCPAPSESCSSP